MYDQLGANECDCHEKPFLSRLAAALLDRLTHLVHVVDIFR